MLKFLTSMVIFGTIGLFRNQIPLNSGVIALCRGVFGVAFLLLVMVLGRKKLNLQAVKSQWGWLSLSGIALGCNWVLLFEAYRFTTVATATVCYYLAPAFLLLASPLLEEKLTGKKLLCLGACLIGMVLVTGVPDGNNLTGILFALGAALLYACVMFFNRKITQVSDLERTVTQMGVVIPVLGIYVLCTGGADFTGLTLPHWGLLATVGVVHTGLAYFLYFSAVGKLPTTLVAVCSYVDPVVAVLLSAIFIAPITLPAILGAGLILGSTLYAQLTE